MGDEFLKRQTAIIIGADRQVNNTDHSMLTAMAAVENIISGRADKSNMWAVNAEEDSHE
jgi:hypothetical protein